MSRGGIDFTTDLGWLWGVKDPEKGWNIYENRVLGESARTAEDGLFSMVTRTKSGVTV
jgi:hypothetical protein